MTRGYTRSAAGLAAGAIRLALEVTFEDAGEGVTLPKFRPAG